MSLEPWFFFSSRRRHTRFKCDWSSDVCSSDLNPVETKGERNCPRCGAKDFNRFCGQCGYKHPAPLWKRIRSEEHTSELQSHLNLVCRLLLEKKKKHK